LVGVGGGKAAGAAAPTCFSIAWAAASRHLSNRKHPALTRTAQYLNSGIFPNGSSFIQKL
jgi:hypothetical protein